jgi:hypothetical protein
MTSQRKHRFAALAAPQLKRSTSTSETVSPIEPVFVPRSRYVRMRALLAVACIVITGLTILVVALATTATVQPTREVQAANASTLAQTADTGERLDHRGLHDGPYVLSALELGARLDHRGVRASSHPLADLRQRSRAGE